MFYKGLQREYKVTKRMWDTLKEKFEKSDACFLKQLSQDIMKDKLVELSFDKHSINQTMNKYNEVQSVMRCKIKIISYIFLLF